MPNGKKSNAFLLGQIYERTELIPGIRKDIRNLREKFSSHVQQDDINFKEVYRQIRKVKKRSGGNLFMDSIYLFRRFIKLVLGR